jgi:hypothetical protein
MAKLKVHRELLHSALFGDFVNWSQVEIVSAEMKPDGETLDLEIRGSAVPEVAEVNAVFTKERQAVRFEPRQPMGRE